MNLPNNMGKTDRNIRFAAAGLLVLAGWLTGSVLLSIIGLIPLATAATGFCPAYLPFNINTKGKEETGA
jgi:hypothetical protein